MENFYATFENTYKYYGGAIDNIHQDSLGNIYATYKKTESETSETHFIGRVNDIKKIELNMGELWITYNSGETVNVGTIKGVNSMKVENDSLIVNYNDGTTANLGVVTAYEVAVENGFCEDQEMTDEEKRRKWYETMIDAADGFSELAGYEIAAEEAAQSANTSATTAKKWAIRDGGNVIPSDTNNSQYYAQLSESWAKGNVTGFESQDENNAKYWAEQAADITANVDEALAAAQAAQHGAETAQGHAESAQGAAETAQGLAETAQNAAETAQRLSENAQSLSEIAQGLSEAAESGAVTARQASEAARDTAAEWATGTTEGTPGEFNNAQYYARISERFSVGTDGGSDELLPFDPDSETPYNPGSNGDNAKAYAIRAGDYLNDVKDYKEIVERYTYGTVDGEPVGAPDPEDPEYDTTGYHDNAKYYHEQALASATSAVSSLSTVLNYKLAAEDAAAAAELSEDNAETYKDLAERSVTNAEAYAIGTRNGVPVSNYLPGTDILDPAFQNNAKYWAEQASEIATSDKDAITAAVIPITTSEIDALFVTGGGS